jgi:hypothetical protein
LLQAIGSGCNDQKYRASLGGWSFSKLAVCGDRGLRWVQLETLS